MQDRRILEAESTSGELDRHVSGIADEFREGFEAVDRIPKPAVTIFGSARVRDGDGPYDQARALARRFSQEGWSVVTGGGPGVMEAANRGAKEGRGL